MKPSNFTITDSITNMIRNLSTDLKLELIDKIKATMKKDKRDPDSDDSWKKLFGAWKSDESADDIIEDLRRCRNTGRKIEDI